MGVPWGSVADSPLSFSSDAPKLWQASWTRCYACAVANGGCGVPCKRQPDCPRCKRCQSRSNPCNQDMCGKYSLLCTAVDVVGAPLTCRGTLLLGLWTAPLIGGCNCLLKWEVYQALLAWWRNNGVGRERRPSPDVRLPHVKLARLPLGLRERVEGIGGVQRARANAQRRARANPNRAEEAAEERDQRRQRRAAGQTGPAPAATGLGGLAGALERAHTLFAVTESAAVDFVESLRDLIVLYADNEDVPRAMQRAAQLRSLANNVRDGFRHIRVFMDALPSDLEEPFTTM